jgi:ribosomal protein S18 acetylase RimI-like enzyme
MEPPMKFRHLWTEDEVACRALIPTLAPWVHEASQPFADWYFATPELASEILCEWMDRPTAEVFVGRAIVMLEPETDGEVVGCLIGLSGADLVQARSADFVAFCRDLGAGDDADQVLAEVVPAARELFPGVREDDLYVSRVAIAPAARSKGLGRRLVMHAVETFRGYGFERFRLDVSADNLAAIRAYEAAGLQVVGRHHSAATGFTYCAMAL